MAETLSLSLQAFPPPDKDKESLQYLIQRVNEQRGSFRNITEQSLEEEIRRLDAGVVHHSQETVVETTVDGEDAETKKEEVHKAREDIRKHIVQATNESAMALEFMSLLLSRHVPAAAQTTMSPELKQMVPLGSLGAEVVQAPQVSAAERSNEEMTVIGWRMQSLNGAVDSLLNSATRLEEEMGKEARYWEQVLAVKEKGWSLHRLPREKHTLGVRYGFAEAYSDFRDRGLAALRRDEDGNLELDRGIRSKGDKRLRVRILNKGKPIASNIRGVDGPVEDSVEKEILKARNSLFDEELHHELDREARNLVNQGVRCIDGDIILPYQSEKHLEISLVSLDDDSPGEATSSDYVADAIAVALRILLSHAHHQNLQNRSKLPPPLREQKPPRPIYALLKPILEYLQHRSYVESTQTVLDGMNKTLTAAGLGMSMVKTLSSETRGLAASTIRPSQSAVDDLLKVLTMPLTTTISLTLPSEATSIIIKAHTALHPPHFGTTFHITIQNPTPKTPISTLPPHTQLTTLPTLETHISDLIHLSILQHLISQFPKWRLLSAHEKSITRNDPKTKDRETVSITLCKAQLSMHYLREGKQKRSDSWSWNGDYQPIPPIEKSLFDVLQKLFLKVR